MWTLASPERGGAPKGRRGCLPPRKPQAVVEGFIAPYGANRSKRRSLRSLFWNGGGEINPFPEFYGNRRLALRDTLISPPLSGFARLGRCPKPCKGAALDLLGLCPRPRKPFFEEKGLEPKNLFNYSQLIRNSTSLLQSFQTQTAVFHQSTGLSSPRFHVSP